MWLSALSVMFFRDPRTDPVAIVRIGVAVAAAHGPVELKAKLPHSHARPPPLGGPALSGIAVAPQAISAADAGRDVTFFAELRGGARAVHRTKDGNHDRAEVGRPSGDHRLLLPRSCCDRIKRVVLIDLAAVIKTEVPDSHCWRARQDSNL